MYPQCPLSYHSLVLNAPKVYSSPWGYCFSEHVICGLLGQIKLRYGSVPSSRNNSEWTHQPQCSNPPSSLAYANHMAYSASVNIPRARHKLDPYKHNKLATLYVLSAMTTDVENDLTTLSFSTIDASNVLSHA
jgi:hypothetical protein